jgi:ABC-type phosphate/phosphonate transport system substrate-binding protein
MIASLPMYDFPEIARETDAFWAALAAQLGIKAPLSRPPDWTAPWRSPDLVFSQTCGYPFTHDFKDVLTYVATPHYEADGCEGPLYRSILFAREQRPLAAFRGTRAAFNNRDSMSGMLALKAVFVDFADRGSFFGEAMETGGHLASMAAVQKGQADICAIDCVTAALCRKCRPSALKGLVECARSPLMPGLPFVTRTNNIAALLDALSVIMAAPQHLVTRQALLLAGFTCLPTDAYQAIPALEQSIFQRGDLRLWS